MNLSSNLDQNGVRDPHFEVKMEPECYSNVPSEAPWTPFGRLEAYIESLWELLESTLELLGGYQSISERLLGAPGTPWGASWGAFGTSWEAFLGSERALGAEKTQK